MKSSKQRRAELVAERASKAAKRKKRRIVASQSPVPKRQTPMIGEAVVNTAALELSTSYGFPEFAARGFYVDTPFRCKDCGKEEIWTATQQKWWYEVAKGHVDTTASRCRPCRVKERSRRDEARRVHLEGLAKKKKLSSAKTKS